IFLVTLGHDQRNRQTQYDFQHSRQIISKYFNLVLKSILRIAHEYVGCRDDTILARVRGDPRFVPYFMEQWMVYTFQYMSEETAKVVSEIEKGSYLKMF
ncbi:hypothetical protein EJ110_NYTH58744, partial [Nymphaea thermarum]